MKKRIADVGFTSLLVLGILSSTSQVHAIHLGPAQGCFASDLNGRWGFRCEDRSDALSIGEFTVSEGRWDGSGTVVFADGTIAAFTFEGPVEVSSACLFKGEALNNSGFTLLFEGALVKSKTELLKIQTVIFDPNGDPLNITGTCTDRKQ